MSESAQTPTPPPGPSYQAPPMPPRQEAGSSSKQTWKWVVGIGCLSIIVLVALCGTVGYFGYSKVSKAVSTIVAAEQRATSNPDVQSRLGAPIMAGAPTMSKGSTLSGTGGTNTSFDVTLPITGPKGSATLHVVAKVVNGKTSYSTMEVTFPDGTKIDLRTDEEKGATEPAGTIST
jgi:hypothetical protein